MTDLSGLLPPSAAAPPAVRAVEDRCPVCRAVLGDADICRRCKTDLSGVRAAERAAARLEAAAMLRLADGDAAAAVRLLRRSLRIHHTPAAGTLLAWLVR